MFGTIISWLSNAFGIFNSISRSIAHWVLNRLYLLVIPLISTIKLIYDFVREILNELLSQFQALGDGLHVGGMSIPDMVAFVNAYFPLDTFFQVLSILFTLWIGCMLISAVLKIKQAVFV